MNNKLNKNSFFIELISSLKISDNTKHLIFKKSDNSIFSFIPGQFLTFLFNIDNSSNNNNAKLYKRSYSIANACNNTPIIEIAVSYINNGMASKHLFEMNVGNTILVLGPHGKLILNKEETCHRLFLIGTNTGIVPYRSMLNDLKIKYSKEIKEIHIVLGIRFKKDAIYIEDFINYANIKNIFFTVYFSKENNSFKSYEKQGYVQNYIRNFNLNEKDVFYLCGNPKMIEDTILKLTKLKINLNNIKTEQYFSIAKLK